MPHSGTGSRHSTGRAPSASDPISYRISDERHAWHAIWPGSGTLVCPVCCCMHTSFMLWGGLAPRLLFVLGYAELLGSAVQQAEGRRPVPARANDMTSIGHECHECWPGSEVGRQGGWFGGPETGACSGTCADCRCCGKWTTATDDAATALGYLVVGHAVRGPQQQQAQACELGEGGLLLTGANKRTRHGPPARPPAFVAGMSGPGGTARNTMSTHARCRSCVARGCECECEWSGRTFTYCGLPLACLWL